MSFASPDKFQKVANGTATRLAGSGFTPATYPATITVDSTAKWPVDTDVTFSIDKITLSGTEEVQTAGTYTLWQGKVASATTITVYGLAPESPNSAQNYAPGSLTRVYIPISAALQNRIVEGITAQHKQDGTHGPVTADSLDAPQGAIKESSVPLQTYRQETLATFVASGCIITQTSGLNWSMTAGVVYINGARYTVAAATGSVTASKDTYFDILAPATGTVATLVNTGGNVVANNAASPALAANSIRIGKVVSGASSITLPIRQSGLDSNNLPLKNISPVDLSGVKSLFSNNIQSYTNPGSAGGTFYYLDLGGIKLLWGVTGLFTSNGNIYGLVVTPPTGFFNSVLNVQTTGQEQVATNNVIVQADAYAPSYIRVSIINPYSTAGAGCKVAVFAIGI